MSLHKAQSARAPLRAMAIPLAAGALCIGLAWFIKVRFVEPEALAFACEPAPWTGWCAARTVIIQSFAQLGLGWASLLSAVMALITRSTLFAYPAWLFGCLGLVLYCYEFAVVGALGGLVVLARKLSQP